MSTPLWRRMMATGTKAPISADGPGHRYAAMLNLIAAELAQHRCGGAAQILLDEAQRADRGE